MSKVILFLSLSIATAFWLLREVGAVEPTKNTDTVWVAQSARYERLLAEVQAKAETSERANHELREQLKASEEKVKRALEAAKQQSETETVLKRKLETSDKEMAQFKEVFEKFWPPKMETVRQVYEKMDVKKAALVLGGLDPELAGYILGSLKPGSSAEILSKMPVDAASKVTRRLVAKRDASSDLKNTKTK